MGKEKWKNKRKLQKAAAAADGAPQSPDEIEAAEARAKKYKTPADERVGEKDKHNAKFEAYYKAQDIIPPEDWDKFMAALRAPLPSSFRISSHSGYAVRGECLVWLVSGA
jgi:hypothetical protein